MSHTQGVKRIRYKHYTAPISYFMSPLLLTLVVYVYRGFINGLALDRGNSSALAMELSQSRAKQSIPSSLSNYHTSGYGPLLPSIQSISLKMAVTTYIFNSASCCDIKLMAIFLIGYFSLWLILCQFYSVCGLAPDRHQIHILNKACVA